MSAQDEGLRPVLLPGGTVGWVPIDDEVVETEGES